MFYTSDSMEEEQTPLLLISLSIIEMSKNDGIVEVVVDRVSKPREKSCKYVERYLRDVNATLKQSVDQEVICCHLCIYFVYIHTVTLTSAQ